MKSTHLPPIWLGLENMWVEFVVGSLPCYERFSLGNCLVFPFPPKPTLQNSNLI